MRELFAGADDADDDFDDADDAVPAYEWPAVVALLARSRSLLDRMPVTDREEAIVLNEQLHLALENGNHDDGARLSKELEDILFFIEER